MTSVVATRRRARVVYRTKPVVTPWGDVTQAIADALADNQVVIDAAAAAVDDELASRNLLEALDEGDMASNSGGHTATQRSIVEYVEARSAIATPTLLVPLSSDLTGRDAAGSLLATATGSARWVPGRSGDPDTALLLEVATTNEVPNPAFAVNTAGWANGGGTISRDTTWAFAGPASGRITPDGTSSHAYVTVTKNLAAITWTATLVLYQETGTDREVRIRQGGGAWVLIVTIPSGEITVVRDQFTGTGTSVGYRVGMTGTPAAGDFLWIGHFGLTAGTDDTTPVPAMDASGALLPGYSWSGTAHASPSTRAEGQLAIPTDARPTALALRYSDDDGDTWDHAYLAADEDTFGAHGEVAFSGGTLTIAPASGGVILDAVRGDDRALTTSERGDLEGDAVWTWTGVRANSVDLTPYTTLDVFHVEHENDGTLRSVSRPNDPLRAYHSTIPAEREYPQLIKPLEAPVVAYEDQPASTIFWPHPVDRRAMAGGEGVSLFWSTDHGSGGIYAAEAPHPLGPYTARPSAAYTQLGAPEAPAVLWDAANSRWNLYVNIAAIGVGSQSTVLATSPDMVTWTKHPENNGIVVDMLDPIEAGDGHTGYLRPFQIGGTWYGYTLYGGTVYGRSAFWTSPDGVHWRPHPRRLGQLTPLLDHLPGYQLGWRFRWIQSTVIRWRGEPWIITTVQASTPGDPTASLVVTAPLAPDLMRLAARPVDITPPVQAWEEGGISQTGAAILWDGELYIPYRGASNVSGGFGMMQVV